VTPARHRYISATAWRGLAVLASILALVGAVLVIVALRSSRPGPPQPSLAAAGVIDGTIPSPGPSFPAPSFSRSPSPGSRPAANSPIRTTSAGSPPASKRSVRPVLPSRPTAHSAAPNSHSPGPTAHSTGPTAPTSDTALKGLILPASPPVSLSIPAIDVSSPLLALGLNGDGSVQVPSLDDPDSKAGWYRNSPAPGSLGPALILGHIDSKKYGPGVFYELGNLKPGQEIDVARQDGQVAVFRVDGVRSYPKAQFPTFEVYGNIDHAGLRLITCGGVFDPGKRSYENNIVVYASLASSHPA